MHHCLYTKGYFIASMEYRTEVGIYDTPISAWFLNILTFYRLQCNFPSMEFVGEKDVLPTVAACSMRDRNFL